MYVLLAVSALVWGWVFIKIFGVLFKGEDTTLKIVKNNRVNTYIAEKDSFELLADYRDPFLKHNSHAVFYTNTTQAANIGTSNHIGHATGKKKNEVLKQEKEARVIDWSFITYKGRITRKSNGKVLSLLNINGGDYSLEDGKEVQKVTLIKNHHDSIEVRYEGIKKYIKRNQN